MRMVQKQGDTSASCMEKVRRQTHPLCHFSAVSGTRSEYLGRLWTRLLWLELRFNLAQFRDGCRASCRFRSGILGSFPGRHGKPTTQDRADWVQPRAAPAIPGVTETAPRRQGEHA